jgi:hypothetical protein
LVFEQIVTGSICVGSSVISSFVLWFEIIQMLTMYREKARTLVHFCGLIQEFVGEIKISSKLVMLEQQMTL